MSFGRTIGRNPVGKDDRQSWTTPKPLFDQLHQVFGFTVDACASAGNALLPRFWTAELDCRLQPWSGEWVFCNPPFREVGSILPKAREAILALVLLPITSLVTKYFRDNPPAVLFVPAARIKFVPPDGLEGLSQPVLGTVLALYGQADPQQVQAVEEMGFLAFLLNGRGQV